MFLFIRYIPCAFYVEMLLPFMFLGGRGVMFMDLRIKNLMGIVYSVYSSGFTMYGDLFLSMSFSEAIKRLGLSCIGF